MGIAIDPCTDDQFEAHFQMCEAAFGRRADRREVLRWRAVLEPVRVLGARVGGQLVGTAGAASLQLTVPGGSVPAAGVVMVGVLPSHRGRGVFRQLMNELLARACERQEQIAVLWASEGGIYRSHGFGLGTLNARIDASPQFVRLGASGLHRSPGTVAALSRDEAIRRLPAVYAELAARTAGAIRRTEPWWSQITLPDTRSDAGAAGNPVQAYVVTVDGKDQAYALVRQHPEYEHRLHHDWIEVLEAVAPTADGHRALWEFLFSMSLVESVRAGFLPVDDPLLLSVEQPGRLRFTVGDGLWVRILDLTALTHRRYNGSGSLIVQVVDPLLAANDGCWRIDVTDGSATVARVNASPEIVVGIDALASAYLGAFSFHELGRAGLVAETVGGAVDRAAMLFTTVSAPWCPEVI